MVNVKFSSGTYNRRFNCYGPENKNQKCPPNHDLPKNSILMPHYGNVSKKTRHAASIRIQSHGGGRMRFGGIKGGGISPSTPFIPETTNWTDRSSTGGGPANWGDSNTPAIASNRTGDKMWAAPYGESIYRSTDYGVTWTQPFTNVLDWTCIASDSAGTNLIAAAGPTGGIWRSTDSGNTWSQIASSPRDYTSAASNADGTVQVVTGDTTGINQVRVSEISAAFVNRIPSALLKPVSIASSYDSSVVAATKFAVTFRTDITGAAGGVIWTSIDTGVTWTERLGVPVSKNWKGICTNIDGLKIFAVISGSNIWRSLDGGANWIELVSPNIATPPTTNLTWNDIACDDTGTNIVAGGTGAGIWISSDGGSTWNDTIYSPPAAFSGQSFASNKDGTMLVAGQTNLALWTLGTTPAAPAFSCAPAPPYQTACIKPPRNTF